MGGVINPKDVVGSRKAPKSTVSVPVMAEVGVAMLEGALKYGRHNYRLSAIRSSIYYDAVNRHLDAWWEGQDIDPDSNLSHITKAIAALTVLRDAQITGKVIDDRPPCTVDIGAFFADLNIKTTKLWDRYGDRNPKHVTIDDTADCLEKET